MKRASVNHSMRTAIPVLSILVCTNALCAEANAQAWLPDRSYTEGPGIRVGNLELHPGIAVRAGYDTNVFRTDDSAAYPAIDSGLVTITPHLNLSTLGAQRATQGEDSGGSYEPKIAFDGGLALTYFQYTKAEAAPPASSVMLGVDTQGTLKILPTRPVNLEVGLAYTRNVQPFTEKASDDDSFANDLINPSLRVNFGSRSKVVNSYVAYSPLIRIYEKTTPFQYLSNTNHMVQLGQSWKFLPHTALLYDAALGIQDYFDLDSDDIGTQTTLVENGRQFQTRIGMNGALTQKLGLRLMVGYALAVFDHFAMSEYENAIGEALLTVRFAQASQFETGYQGTVVPSAVGGWMRTDKGVARLRMLFGGVFLLGLEGSAGYVTYGRMLAPARGSESPVPGDVAVTALGAGGTTERDDVRFDAAVRTEYRVTNWLAFMADYAMIATLTDFEYAPSAGPPPFPAQFIDHEIFGGVRAHY